MARLTQLKFLGLAVLLALDGVPCFPADVSRDLKGIKKKIESEKSGISQVQKKEGSVQQGLERIQRELKKQNKELKQANSKLKAVLSEKREKEGEAERIRAALRQRQVLLAKRAGALYRWQRGGSPFVLLNGDVSPGVLLRRKHYLETTLAFDRGLVRSLSEQVARYESVKMELARKQEEVTAQWQKLAEIREETQRQKDKKRDLLTSLRREKEARLRALKELEQAARRAGAGPSARKIRVAGEGPCGRSVRQDEASGVFHGSVSQRHRYRGPRR
jgi:septal ring factor EnvC (AmiA/AmiB activator)